MAVPTITIRLNANEVLHVNGGHDYFLNVSPHAAMCLRHRLEDALQKLGKPRAAAGEAA